MLILNQKTHLQEAAAKESGRQQTRLQLFNPREKNYLMKLI